MLSAPLVKYDSIGKMVFLFLFYYSKRKRCTEDAHYFLFVDRHVMSNLLLESIECYKLIFLKNDYFYKSEI